jgi:hypothetical protein
VCGGCGANGICVYTPVPACVCAPGFEVITQVTVVKVADKRTTSVVMHKRLDLLSYRTLISLGMI